MGKESISKDSIKSQPQSSFAVMDMLTFPKNRQKRAMGIKKASLGKVWHADLDHPEEPYLANRCICSTFHQIYGIELSTWSISQFTIWLSHCNHSSFILLLFFPTHWTQSTPPSPPIMHLSVICSYLIIVKYHQTTPSSVAGRYIFYPHSIIINNINPSKISNLPAK